MRTPIIAGNWKMHKTSEESVIFAQDLLKQLDNVDAVECVIAPTFLSLVAVSDAIKGSKLKVSAQNAHWETHGAYTSQVAAKMLVGVAEYVIIGHSECRQYLHETDEMINKKAKALLELGLKPIIAVGESLEQNEAGETQAFVSGQVRAALDGISADDMLNIVIAYEPIWAIGTGKNATAQQANDIVGGVVRQTLRDLYGDEIAEQVRIQYGGSVKPENMLDYMGQPDIDGALVGGASLEVDKFVELINLAGQAKGL
jgi:triosephosphate isomerase